MLTLTQDLRFGLRLLARNPAFTSVAILSMAIGVGANTAVFSVIDALVLRTLPVPQAEELVSFGPGREVGITNGFPKRQTELFSPDFYRLVQNDEGAFRGVTAMSSVAADVHARVAGAGADLEPLQA